MPHEPRVRNPIQHTCPPGTPRANCPCTLARRREWMTPEAHRRHDLRARFGITPDEWDAMYAAQEGRCAVCGQHEDDVRPVTKNGRRGLVVDHCHRGGNVRALLCAKCNAGLGYFDDDPERLRIAAAYLKQARAGRERSETEPEEAQ